MTKEELETALKEANEKLAESERREAELAQKEAQLAEANERLKAETAAQKANDAVQEARGAKNPRRMVVIKLFKGDGKYSDAVYVNVNNKNFLIPRGVPVAVPYYVARHIAEMTEQDENTAKLISMQEAEYDRVSDKLN